MTPKEKAQELVDKMYYSGRYLDSENYIPLQALWRTKQCALIAINEMIMQNGELYINNLGNDTIKFYKEKNAYLFEVKQEIEKL